MNEPHKDNDLHQVLERIRTWKLEALNPRNDGWVQNGNKERIKKVLVEADKALKTVGD